jgi:arylsulfatase A-like enzyme
MHATSLGTQNLRSDIAIPEFIKTLPEVLGHHGYFTTNNAKTDYNFNSAGRWDESNNRAHWRNRANKDQPFFSVFNLGVTHEGRLNTDRFGEDLFEPLDERHDPSDAELPPFFPDTPEMRELWARQYDLISLADLQMQDILQQLEEDGLAENTIVFFWSDHGFGLPRYKRWLYTTGLEVALIVRIPEKYRQLAGLPPGSETTRLVSLVDLAPTVLSLAGIEQPDYMEGKPFLGEFEEEPRTHFVAHRDRADDVYDMARAVRTKDFMYIRNYMPHLPYIQPSVIFSDEKRSYAELHKVRREGILPESGEAMYRPRPKEELYDVQADPYELNNLADDPQFQFVLEKMRGRLNRWIFETRDTGFLQEAEMMLRAEDSTPYQVVNNPETYNLPKIKAAAELVGDNTVPVSILVSMLNNPDSGVRYWASEAILARVNQDAWKAIPDLLEALKDENPVVQIKAAETLCMLGDCDEALAILVTYLQADREWLALQSAISVRQLGERVKPITDEIKQTRINYSGDTGSRGYRDWGYAMFIGFAMDQALETLNETIPSDAEG